MIRSRCALLLVAVFCSQAIAVEVNEAVLEEGASGTAVVLLSIAHLQQAAIFPAEDNELVRRIAYVETRDGTVSNIDNEGGIWAVNGAAFESTKDTSGALLAGKHELILQHFNIAWPSVQLKDLRRPFYSALAASLLLCIAPQAIPNEANMTGQAQFWRENYNTDGSVDEFLRATRELQNRGAPASSASDFYIGFTGNTETANQQLIVTTRELDPVTFTVDTLFGLSITGVVTRNSSFVVPLGSFYQVFSSDERSKGIHVSAGDKQITVYGLSLRDPSEAFLALPCSRLQVVQYEYYSISYGPDPEIYNSQLLFVGCEDNTIINFASISITLNRMETYLHTMSIDNTGTRIISNKPISLFSGHECANVPAGVFVCNYLTEQIPTTAIWGTTFLSASLAGRMSGEIYRILASQPSTNVSVNCTTYTQPEIYSLDTAGAWQEFMTPNDSYCLIESNKPLLVIEFALGYETDRSGGPFMMMLPPIQQYSNDYILHAPSTFRRNFITIFVPTEFFDPEKIYVDNISQEQANWTTIYCLNRTICGYAVYAIFEAGDHHLYHSDTQARIGVSVYGFNFVTSYGYPGGLQSVPIQFEIGSGDSNNNNTLAISISITAAVVVVLIISSGCIISGIAFWRCYKNHTISVSHNSAYGDVRQEARTYTSDIVEVQSATCRAQDDRQEANYTYEEVL